MLTPRENLLRILRHEMPEWTPVSGHVDPYNQPNRRGMDPELARQLGEVTWRGDSTVIFSRYLGLDITDYYGPPIKSTRKAVTIQSVQDGDHTVNTWHTPVGNLREVRRYAPDIGTSYLVERVLKGPEDLAAMTYAFEDEQIEFDGQAYEQLKARQELIGDDGILMIFLPGTPLGMLVRVYSGVEALAYLHADAPRELRALFDAMERNHRRRFEVAASVSEGDALVGMDDTSTTAISPGMFEQYSLDYTDHMSDVAHAAGKVYFHHSCGLIKNILGLYRQTRMDAVHGFTIPPIGDVTVAEGRRLLGDRITIFAGLVQLFGNMDDRDAVARSIAAMFEGSGRGDHFILGLAGDPEKTMAETQFVLDECRKHQRPLPRSVQ